MHAASCPPPCLDPLLTGEFLCPGAFRPGLALGFRLAFAFYTIAFVALVESDFRAGWKRRVCVGPAREVVSVDIGITEESVKEMDVPSHPVKIFSLSYLPSHLTSPMQPACPCARALSEPSPQTIALTTSRQIRQCQDAKDFDEDIEVEARALSHV